MNEAMIDPGDETRTKSIWLKAAVGAGVLSAVLVAILAAYNGSRNNDTALDKLVADLRAEGPWYYRLLKRTKDLGRFPRTLFLRNQILEFEPLFKRWRAALALAQLGTNAWPAVPVLIDTLKHPDFEIRLRAAQALADIHAERHPEWAMLQQRFRDQVKAADVFHYMAMGMDGTGRADNVTHRRFGLLSLAGTGKAARGSYTNMVSIVKLDKDPEIRAYAVNVLGVVKVESQQTVPMLRDLLKNEEEWPVVSASAAHALAAFPADATTRDLLYKALQDRRSAVRVAAVRALWRLKAPPEDFVPVLTAALKHKLPSTRLAALNGLSEVGKPAQGSWQQIEPLTSDENEDVRLCAVKVLSGIRGQGSSGSQ